MNNQVGMQGQDSEVVHLNAAEEGMDEDEEESFGDLDDQNAGIQEEDGLRIIIDEDTMESNDTLIASPDPQNQHPLPNAALAPPTAAQGTQPTAQRGTFYQDLISKLEESSYNDETLEPSWTSFEAEERRYLERVKIIYCHFLVGDRALSQRQFQQLRALLFVPSYGQSLLRWGNKKYSHSLTLSTALERLDYLERLAQHRPKTRCREEIRLLVMAVLLLLIIKLLS